MKETQFIHTCNQAAIRSKDKQIKAACCPVRFIKCSLSAITNKSNSKLTYSENELQLLKHCGRPDCFTMFVNTSWKLGKTVVFCGFEWNKYCPVVSVWSFFGTCWNIWALTKSRIGISSYILIADSKHFRPSHHFLSHDCSHGYRCLKFCWCISLRTLTRNMFFFIITCRFWGSDLVPTSLRINTSLSLSQKCLTKPPLHIWRLKESRMTSHGKLCPETGLVSRFLADRGILEETMWGYDSVWMYYT